MKEDLERYLAGKPVKARGYGYSFHFLLNPKMAIATVAIVFLLLGIFISKLSVSRENIIKENATIEKNKISEKDIKKIEPKPNETKHIPDPSPEVAAPVKPNIERGVWAEFSHPQKSVLKKHAKGLWYIPYRSSLPTDRSGNFLILPVNSCIVFSFDLPEIKKDEYKIKLEIEHLTSMDDSIPGKHRPGFSPISIEVNGKILEKGFNPNDGGPITTSWYIQGHANKGNNIITIKPYIKYTTHYWLSSIRILLE